MDFSEIAEDDFSSLGFEFDNDVAKPMSNRPRGGGGGRGPPGRMPRGMPPRPFGPRGNRGGPPPRFMGPGPPRPPFPPMRSPMRGQMRPPFPPRGMSPAERPPRPPFRNRLPRRPSMERPKKEPEMPPKIVEAKEVVQKPVEAVVVPPTPVNNPVQLKTKKEGSEGSDVDEDKLLQESGDEAAEVPEPRRLVDLDDAVSIHGDEEFENEKVQDEKSEEKKEENTPEKDATPVKESPNSKSDERKVDEENQKNSERPRRRDDRGPRNRDFNIRGRGRGGNRDFHHGRDQPMFRGPDREYHRFQEPGHRPFPAGPMPPNLPPPMHPPKNIHVNPRFMGPRPRFDGPRGPPMPMQLPAPHPVPHQAMPPRVPHDMRMPPMHPNDARRSFPDVPPAAYPPTSMPPARDVNHRFVPPPQVPIASPARRMMPAGQGGMPMPEPLNMQMPIRNQAPMMHPAAQFNHPALPVAMQPGDQLHRPVQPPGLHAALNNPMARASPYDMNRALQLGNRGVANDRSADLAALYTSQAAYMQARQQYPANLQQMYDMNWQQQMRREPAFAGEQAELSTKTKKHTRERTTRAYSDQSDLSSRSRSGSFSDSRSYSRSPSRSWSRSASPSPTRSWSKSLSRSRSRSPLVRSRSSPKREVRLSRNVSPVRRVERAAKRNKEARREPKRERGRRIEQPSPVVRNNDPERAREKPRVRRAPRGDNERAREKERGRNENARAERGRVDTSRERPRERGRNVENQSSRSRERGGGTGGARRSKTDSTREQKESHGSSRHSRRGSADRKPAVSSTSESKANRVVATKSSSSGKPSNRIVIGSLPDSITPSKLKELLATIGPIEQLKMSTTKHKALVTFEKHEHALACRRKFHRAKVDDSQITVDFL